VKRGGGEVVGEGWDGKGREGMGRDGMGREGVGKDLHVPEEV